MARAAARLPRRLAVAVVVLLVAVGASAADGEDGREVAPEYDIEERDAPSAGSLADIIDRVLEKEFPDHDPSEANEAEVGSNFNTTIAESQATLETVARVTHEKPKKNESAATETSKRFQFKDLFAGNKDEESEGAASLLIDSKDNVFVLSSPRLGTMVLQQDLQLISDLVVVIVLAAAGGVLFAFVGQPVITGYLIAGAAIGPGGFGLIRQVVQVESLAQFGVLFLLFSLGMEFSLAKLKVVRPVAIGGGLLQISLFMGLCGVLAVACGGRITEGVIVGALLSMSSTALVLKCLAENNTMQTLHGQVTVGTLLLQNCTVGLLFAMLPALGQQGSHLQRLQSVAKELTLLVVFVVVAMLLAYYFMPYCLKLLHSLSAQTAELYQLCAIAFCLSMAYIGSKLGVTIELGAFVAGVMISTSDLAEHTLEQVDPIRNIFGALFMACIGMIMSPAFMWTHINVMLASLLVAVVAKTALITCVVRAFGYSTRSSLTVGLSLAQIGEFAFVLLSRASNLHLVQRKVYLLLLGTTALSLVATPLVFWMTPHIVRFGVLMRWLQQESDGVEIAMNGDHSNGRFISLSVQPSKVLHDSGSMMKTPQAKQVGAFTKGQQQD